MKCIRKIQKKSKKHFDIFRITIDRKKLDEIIHKDGARNWWNSEGFTKNILPLLPSELEILEYPPKRSENFNYFIYAFGFSQDKVFLKETGGFLYSEFVAKLLECGELEKTDNPQEGDYVVYQNLETNLDELMRIGVLKGEKIISKWAWGPLVRHEIWDVPASYGDDIFYIKSVSSNEMEKLYEKFKKFNALTQ